MNEIRFKRLSNKNFLELDPVMANFVLLERATGTARNVSARQWASRFLGPQLSKSVPRDVVELVEGARGSMVYGCFFYPLYAIGEAQLFLAAESALRARLQTTRSSSLTHRRFHALLGLARKQGIITDDHLTWWKAMERLRNSAMHPDFQRLGPPGWSLQSLARTCSEISGLFDAGVDADSSG